MFLTASEKYVEEQEEEMRQIWIYQKKIYSWTCDVLFWTQQRFQVP